MKRRGTAVGYGAMVLMGIYLILAWSGPSWAQGQGGKVTVPDVVGMNLDQAEATLTTAGLMVGGVVYKPDSDANAGTVIRQRPEAGTQVSSGRPVILTVSAGSPERAREWFRNVYRRFDELDTDQSGGLSREEILAAITDLSQLLFDAIDADNDGQVSKAELETFLQLGGLFGCARRVILGGFALRAGGDLLLSGLGLSLLAATAFRRRG